MENPFSLEGKCILVTGASSGIGRGIAVACAKMGAKVLLSGRNEARLQETLSLMSGDGHTVLCGDLNSEETRKEVVEKIPDLNGVVYCAGISQIQMAKRMEQSSLEGIFQTNVFSPLMLNTLLLKKKKIKKDSSIIFISSISGVYRSQIGEGGYGATKAALTGYVKSLALELAAQGIRVNTIHPGVVETPLLEVSNGTFGEEELEALRQKYPLKRFGKPEDIAHCAVYLLSDASSWMTGSNLLIDGGFTLK
ncbi:MAG: SDR family oxidoreductase [Paludibacteraceae bacterium]|nr:SDR family oxidoreductase [Paludibacteraceae bacterium]MBP5664526.1 SDR family oxidoreductase [Bacteroidales bacterium]